MSIIELIEKVGFMQQMNVVSEEVNLHLIHYAQKNNIAPKDIFLAIIGVLLQKYFYTSNLIFGVMCEDEIKKNSEKKLRESIYPIEVRTDQVSTLNSIIKVVTNRCRKSNDLITFHEIDKVIDNEASVINMLVLEETISIKKYFSLLNQDDLKELREFEIVLVLKEVEEKYTYYVLYNPKSYGETKIKYFISHLNTLLKDSVQGFDKKINDLCAVSKEEEKQILCDFSKGNTIIGKEDTIVSLFENQVRRTPQRIAMVYENKSLTYQQLNNRANMIQNTLIRNGVRTENSVIILSKHCTEQMIGILGILKAGGAYVPISPEYPIEWIKYIIDDCDAKLILTTEERKFTEINLPVINISEEVYDADTQKYEVKLSTQNLAYIIYTSGTTGKPKGIMVEHKGVVNLCNHFIRKIYDQYHEANWGIKEENIIHSHIELCQSSEWGRGDCLSDECYVVWMDKSNLFGI